MADRPDDDPKKRDTYGKHFKKIITFGHSDWNYFFPAAALPILMGISVGATSLFGPEKPPADPDLYTGLFNDTKAYSYVNARRSGEERWLMLLSADGRTEVYERLNNSGLTQNNSRLILIEDAAQAKAAIEAAIAAMQGRIDDLQSNPMDFDPIANTESGFSTCDYVSEPFNYAGHVERYKDGCPIVNLPGHSVVAAQEAELAHWRAALAQMEQAPQNYGPRAGDILTLTQHGLTARLADNSAGPAFSLLAIWLAGSAGAAAASYARSRRRPSPKGNKPS